MKNLSNFRSVRLSESSLERDLHQRHSMRLHGVAIGMLVLLVMWASSYLQRLSGVDSLAIRYLVTLGIGYVGYLAILRVWAAALLRREHGGFDLGGDVPVGDAVDGALDVADAGDIAFEAAKKVPVFRAGGGGNFGGGGASADLGAAVSRASTGAGSDGLLGDVASGALDAVGSADEGAVIVVPVVAIFLIGTALLFGAGSLLMLYFGIDALLAVAVEIAFSVVTARAAGKLAREGWVSAAIRLTWKPLLGALFCAVLLGATIDWFIPQAQSLPHALQIIRASSR